MDVLCYLAQYHERVISNDELIAQVWSGRIVTHGSVQKSINLLRKALSELVGEQEFVTHYSKKGYQLQVTPVVLASEPNEHHSNRARRLRHLGLAALALSLGILGLYLYTIRHTLLIPANHRTDFATVRAYTSEVGHERAGEPHPDNQHMVYVRERFTGDGTESELVIRDGQGDDWVLAGSAGSWVDLAWSPGGKQLAAVELIYEAGPLLRPNQNVRAPLLYDLHVFSVDLRTQMVNETHRLSQWQGRINSITWWDDSTLEVVATQGHGALNRRYRYAVQSQRLSPLESLDFVANPLISKVHNGLTAVASLHDGRTRVDFLRRDQSRFASQQLEAAAPDLSWVPDGSGVLAHAPDQQSLTLVRRDGRTQSLFLPYRADTWLSTPRYSADGNRLFFTEERPQTPRSEERRVGKECRSGRAAAQAEDGIRDGHVTGVQTCALPILGARWQRCACPCARSTKPDTGAPGRKDPVALFTVPGRHLALHASLQRRRQSVVLHRRTPANAVMATHPRGGTGTGHSKSLFKLRSALFARW